MKHKRELRKAIRKILIEDADAFEKGLAYIKDTEGLRTDAAKYASAKGANKEETLAFFQDGVFDWLKELGDTAEAIDDLAKESLPKYDDDGESSVDLNDKQQQIVDELEKQDDAKGFVKRYKAACKAFDVPTMSAAAFVNQFQEKGIDGTIEYVKDQWKDAYPDLADMFEKLVKDDSFDHEAFGVKPESSSETDEEATVETAEEELDDVEEQLEDFSGSLEEFIEAAYKAKDTDEYKSLVKDFELQQKYQDFVMKLFNKIIEFAKSKERQDVVELTNNNLGVFNSYITMQREKNYEFRKQLAADDEGYDIDDVSGGNPSQKTIKGMAKAYKAQIEDFKKIVASIKKNPLKKMDEENILKESSRRLDRVLMEIKIQQYTRKRLNGQLRG